MNRMKGSFIWLIIIFICSNMLHAQTSVTGGVRGFVAIGDNAPATNATIKIEGQQTKSIVTADDGKFFIGNLEAGNYKLTITHIGYSSYEQDINIKAGKIADLKIILTPLKENLEEVIIESNRVMNKSASTANKMPLTTMESAQVVSSISDVILRKQNAMTLEDAMKNAPGVTKLWDATSRPDGGSIFTMRGFYLMANVRNGLPNNLNTNVDMANLDKIEIIKGPSATLFGSIISSYGGLINRVTKKPAFSNSGYADFSFGSYGFYRVSGDANFVLSKDKVAARINIATSNQNSWQDNGFQKSFIIAPSLVYKHSDRLTFNFDGEFVNTKGNSNGGNFMFILTPNTINAALYNGLINTGLPKANVDAIMAQAPKTIKEAFGTDKVNELNLDYNRSYLSNDVYTTTQSNAFYGTADYQLSNHWKSFTAITYGQSRNEGFSAYQYLVPNYFVSLVKSLQTGIPDFGSPGYDSLARMVWNPIGHTNTFNIQQNFTSDYQAGIFRNRAVIGLDYLNYQSYVTYNRFVGSLMGFPYADVFDMTNTDGSSANYNNFTYPKVLSAFGSNTTSTLPYNSGSRVYGAYINDVMNITDYVIASVGVRIDHFQNLLTNDDNKQTKLSPKFGLIFMPVKDQLSIFANYQNSFKNQFGQSFDQKSFNPEEANQKEVGIKYSLFGNRITGSISYYNILVKNIIRDDPAHANFTIQDGQQKSKGIDADLVANPATGWIILLGYGYNDSKYLKADSLVNGRRPVTAGPRNTFSFWTNYTFTQGSLNGLGIGAGINSASETYAVNQNADDKLIMPAYTIVSANATYDTKRLRLGIKLNNLTNQKYWMGWTNFIPQMPRQVIGSVAVKF